MSKRDAHRVLRALTALDPAPMLLVASGSLPPGLPTDFYRRVAQRARREGAKLALDASGEALAQALDAAPWLIKPNLAELQDLVGRPLPDLSARVEACESLRALGVE